MVSNYKTIIKSSINGELIKAYEEENPPYPINGDEIIIIDGKKYKIQQKVLYIGSNTCFLLVRPLTGNDYDLTHFCTRGI